MTVISTVIANPCIVFGSDSLLTAIQENGDRVARAQRPKIITIPELRAGMAYWGTAELERQAWNAYDWLSDRAASADRYETLEQFVRSLRDSLEGELRRLDNNLPHHGIVIHIAGYEVVGEFQVPELFLVSNYSDPTYMGFRPLGVSRETYHIRFREDPSDRHGSPECRLQVKECLDRFDYWIYNNGNPTMFLPVLRALQQQIEHMAEKGLLTSLDDPRLYRAIAVRTIEFVANVQADCCRDGGQSIGGPVHDLTIYPDGTMRSESGILHQKTTGILRPLAEYFLGLFRIAGGTPFSSGGRRH